MQEEKQATQRTSLLPAQKAELETDSRVPCSNLNASQDIAESSAQHAQLGLSSLIIHTAVVSHVSTSQKWQSIPKMPKVRQVAATSANSTVM